MYVECEKVVYLIYQLTTNTKTMKPQHEILSTKDANNVLQFHNDNYFMNEDGVLKNKYYQAIQQLHKDNIIELNSNFNHNTNEWEFFWTLIG